MDIREVIKKPEYKWLEEYKDRLVFLTFGGSHAYGTSLPTSDIDIRGVMLPKRESLVGLQTENQRIDEESDTCIYEFKKFIKLINNSNPNTIELMGCKPDQVLVFNDFGKELLDNINWFISRKAIFSFSGYAVSQLRRIQNALIHDQPYSAEDKEKYMLETINVIKSRNLEYNQRFADKIDLEILEDKINVSIKEGNYDLRQLSAALNEFNTVLRTFDKLNQRNNKKDELHLNKHCMHLFRLQLMLIDILEGKGVNTYREKDIPFLMDIRNGKYKLEDKDNEIWIILKQLEDKVEKLKEETLLPKLPNYKEIEKFVIKVNSSVIKQDFKQYDEPKLLSEF